MDENGEAFARQLDRLRSAAMRIATRELGNVQDAEDAVQDATISAWQSRATFDPDKGRLKSWFFTIVDNQCKMHKRKRRTRAKQPPPEILELDDPEVAAMIDKLQIPPELQIDWGECWDQLTERQREVMGMSLDGYRGWEIARELGIDETAVYHQIGRAKERLRRYLKEEGSEWKR